jgi:hypothetical protein
MFAMRAFGESAHSSCGSMFTAQEVQELEGLNRGSIHVLKAMVIGGRATTQKAVSMHRVPCLWWLCRRMVAHRHRSQ